MITLYQFPRIGELSSACPFCLKLETYMKLTQLPYKTVDLENPSKCPTGKLPLLRDGAKTIADSSLIIDYLKAAYGDPLDGALTPPQKGQSLAMQRLVENHLAWVMIYAMWLDDRHWPALQSTLHSDKPTVMEWFRMNRTRSGFRKMLYLQGMGRHDRSTIYQMGFDDLDAVYRSLRGKDFFFGERPSGVDATLYAFLAHIHYFPINSPLKTHVKALTGLTEYCERVARLL